MPSAFAAGIVGAVVLDAFLLIFPYPNTTQPSFASFYTQAAMVLAGPTAQGAAWAIPLGIVGHLAVGVAWAFGYTSLANAQPQLVRRPWISGLAFGFVVSMIMIGVLVFSGKYAPSTQQAFDRDVVSYTVFFGLPLALVVARLTRVPAPA
jgi:hypothetical protein